MKNCFAVAILTCKEIVRQTLFYVIIAGGTGIILLTSCLTLFAFGEELRLLRDMGITTITMGGVIIGIFYIGGAFSDEAKRVAAATILSKPVNKWEFVIGKCLGTICAISSVDMILAISFVSVLTIYNNHGHPAGQGYLSFEYVHVLLGIYSAVLKAIILTTISLLMAFYLTAASNVTVSIAIYLAGHLSGYFSAYLAEREGMIGWILGVIFTIIPDLQGLELGGIGSDNMHGYEIFVYLFNTSAYTLCYSLAMIVLALMAFQRRDML